VVTVNNRPKLLPDIPPLFQIHPTSFEIGLVQQKNTLTTDLKFQPCKG
jgi:hypothetical protein